jgi:hypothetical protein
MLKLTRAQQERLAELVDSTVSSTLLGKQGVPAAANLLEAIGATVSSALPACGDAWRRVLQPLGLRVNVIGAFSFGCPKVEIAAEAEVRRCDLGSLLLVVDDLRRHQADRRALLLSMRLAGGEVNPVQEQLYATWPAFRLAGGAYRDGPRDLGMLGGEAGSFFEIDLEGGPTWNLSRDGERHGAQLNTLGAQLAAMTVGRSGRRATVHGADPWSATVGELLNRTARVAIDGLGPQSSVRSATTYEGESGSGLVVLEHREGLPLESALAQAQRHGHAGLEGPISVANVMFRTV